MADTKPPPVTNDNGGSSFPMTLSEIPKIRPIIVVLGFLFTLSWTSICTENSALYTPEMPSHWKQQSDEWRLREMYRTYSEAQANHSDAVDRGLMAQVAGGHPLEPVASVLPKKLYLIYGLESSGTTFTAKTIASALNCTNKQGDFMVTKDRQTHIQHISLPWGYYQAKHVKGTTSYALQMDLPIVPVMYPSGCRIDFQGNAKPPDMVKVRNKECIPIMGEEIMARPPRLFLNISSHVQWYRERGVKVYPIMVVRDPFLHFQGIVNKESGHCTQTEAAFKQMEMGRAIMDETIDPSSPVRPILVSYEAMMNAHAAYWRPLYRQLQISTSYIPSFKNGNTKYVSKQPPPNSPTEVAVDKALMKEDGSDFVPKSKAKKQNPASVLAAIRAQREAKRQGTLTQEKIDEIWGNRRKKGRAPRLRYPK